MVNRGLPAALRLLAPSARRAQTAAAVEGDGSHGWQLAAGGWQRPARGAARSSSPLAPRPALAQHPHSTLALSYTARHLQEYFELDVSGPGECTACCASLAQPSRPAELGAPAGGAAPARAQLLPRKGTACRAVGGRAAHLGRRADRRSTPPRPH